MSAVHLAVEALSWSPPRGRRVLHPTSFALPAGQILGIVGHNGAGKTTLLRLLYRYLRPETGRVLIDGTDIWQIPARAAARHIAVVLQEQAGDFGLSVAEIVALGRTPHRRGFAGRNTSRDAGIVAEAMARLHLQHLADRPLGTLSGGERQRVMVARALAQEPGLLILDEPTTHLDIRHQLEILALIRGLPLTIVTSLHDLNLAAGLCDAVLLIEAGRPVGFGAPRDVLCETAVSRVFAVTARRERLAPSDTDHLTFHLPQERIPT